MSSDCPQGGYEPGCDLLDWYIPLPDCTERSTPGHVTHTRPVGPDAGPQSWWGVRPELLLVTVALPPGESPPEAQPLRGQAALMAPDHLGTLCRSPRAATAKPLNRGDLVHSYYFTVLKAPNPKWRRLPGCAPSKVSRGDSLLPLPPPGGSQCSLAGVFLGKYVLRPPVDAQKRRQYQACI